MLARSLARQTPFTISVNCIAKTFPGSKASAKPFVSATNVERFTRLCLRETASKKYAPPPGVSSLFSASASR